MAELSNDPPIQTHTTKHQAPSKPNQLYLEILKRCLGRNASQLRSFVI